VPAGIDPGTGRHIGITEAQNDAVLRIKGEPFAYRVTTDELRDGRVLVRAFSKPTPPAGYRVWLVDRDGDVLEGNFGIVL